MTETPETIGCYGCGASTCPVCGTAIGLPWTLPKLEDFLASDVARVRALYGDDTRALVEAGLVSCGQPRPVLPSVLMALATMGFAP